MSDASVVTPPDLLQLTAQIVSAHVEHGEVAADAVPGLIQLVHAALRDLGQERAPSTDVAERPQPAVPIKKSVQPEYIVCLEDGAKLKMLKRYLRTRHDMSPHQYRERWGLPPDYPMVAPLYAEQRATLARSHGLGRKRAEVTAEPAETPRRRGKPRQAAR